LYGGVQPDYLPLLLKISGMDDHFIPQKPYESFFLYSLPFIAGSVLGPFRQFFKIMPEIRVALAQMNVK